MQERLARQEARLGALELGQRLSQCACHIRCSITHSHWKSVLIVATYSVIKRSLQTS